MVAISFSVFKDKIKSGEKTQTIRPYSENRFNLIKRKRVLQLYWKQRDGGGLIKTAVLESIDIIRLYAPAKITEFEIAGESRNRWIWVWTGSEWEKESEEGKKETIKRDGFNDEFEFYTWFEKHYKGKVVGMNFMRIRWSREDLWEAFRDE